jgi:uncharacterized protein YbjQ (UPF0145 family)
MIWFYIYVGIPLAILLVALMSGRIIEAVHLRSLDRREAELSDIGISNLDPQASFERVHVIGYVDGQAVIAADRFKMLLTSFRKFFGGEMRSLVTVVARARREAVVRMLQDARARGADQVWNMRIETSSISKGEDSRSSAAMAEVHAYGTAVKLHRP